MCKRIARNNHEKAFFELFQIRFFSDWWRHDDVTIYCHDNKSVPYITTPLTSNIDRPPYLCNLETILLGNFNIDYLRSHFKNHRLVKSPRDTNFVPVVSGITLPVSRSCLYHIGTNTPEHILQTFHRPFTQVLFD